MENKLTDKIDITLENGEVKEFEVVDFITTDNGCFVVYKDDKLTENGNPILYVNSVIEENDEIILEEVDEEDLKGIIDDYKERLQ